MCVCVYVCVCMIFCCWEIAEVLARNWKFHEVRLDKSKLSVAMYFPVRSINYKYKG